MNNYWGLSDISVQFCEDKYTRVFWIAEYYNTMSSLCYVIIGIIGSGYSKKISVGVIFVGIGSMVLHGTLRWYGQWMDEIAMLSTITFGIEKYKPEQVKKYYLPILIFLYINFYQEFIFLFSVFVFLSCYLCYVTKNKIYLSLSILGGLCWLGDQLFCDYFKQWNLHLWWHIFTSAGILPVLINPQTSDCAES